MTQQASNCTLSELVTLPFLKLYEPSLTLVLKDLLGSCKDQAVQKAYQSVDRVVFTKVFQESALCGLVDGNGRTIEFRLVAKDAVTKLVSLSGKKPAGLTDFIKQAISSWLEVRMISVQGAKETYVGKTVFRFTNSAHTTEGAGATRLVGYEHIPFSPKAIDGTVVTYSPLNNSRPDFCLHHGVRQELFDLHVKDPTFQRTLIGFHHTYHFVIGCVVDGQVPDQKEGLFFLSKALPLRKPFEPPPPSREETKAID